MIVKIKFSENLIMMFGNSYKPWHMQFKEWVCNKKIPILISVETAPEKWIGWGGLKWCSEELFQKQLDREGCQENEPDNSNPRKYENMEFKRNLIVARKVHKIIKECRRAR